MQTEIRNDLDITIDLDNIIEIQVMSEEPISDRGLFSIKEVQYRAEDGDELKRVIGLLKTMFANVEIDFINE